MRRKRRINKGESGDWKRGQETEAQYDEMNAREKQFRPTRWLLWQPHSPVSLTPSLTLCLSVSRCSVAGLNLRRDTNGREKTAFHILVQWHHKALKQVTQSLSTHLFMFFSCADVFSCRTVLLKAHACCSLMQSIKERDSPGLAETNPMFCFCLSSPAMVGGARL